MRCAALRHRVAGSGAAPDPTAQAVYLLRFGSAAAQKAALTRLSNTVLPAVPTGRVAGPASYSGHNCRAEDAARFFAQAKCGGRACGGRAACTPC